MSNLVECPGCDGGREPWACKLCRATGKTTPAKRDAWHEERRDAESRRVQQGRAVTDEQKRAIVERIYTAWTQGDARFQRLGQLLANSTWMGGNSMHLIEDEALTKAVEAFVGGKSK